MDMLKVDKITAGYRKITILKSVSAELQEKEIVAIVGSNGAGKSTLLKILAGVIDINSGERIVGYNVDIGYFSQTRMDVLNPENTVLEAAYSSAPGYMAQESIRTILGAFLFTGEDSDKKVRVLSGGEKSRLILAKLLINPPNFLLLDEPTTHLDVDAVDALVKALTEYDGTIVFISHDIHFVRSVANTVYEVRDGNVRKFSGGFDYYLEKKEKGEIYNQEPREKAKTGLPKKEEGHLNKKAEEHLRKEDEAKRKYYNSEIKKRIEELKVEKDKLNLESFSKKRAIENPRGYRDNEALEEYIFRLQEIESRISEINDEIRKFKKQILP